MKEIWKNIDDYNGDYQVSNYGNIRSFKRCKAGKLMSPAVLDTGYVIVGIRKNGHKDFHYIHRLVAQAFIDNPDNKPEVNHIGGNKANNSVDNLEWSTSTENKRHAIDTGLRDEVAQKISKANSKQVKCITTGSIYDSLIEAENQTRVACTNIGACCRGKLKSVGKTPFGEKLVWEYI